MSHLPFVTSPMSRRALLGFGAATTVATIALGLAALDAPCESRGLVIPMPVAPVLPTPVSAPAVEAPKAEPAAPAEVPAVVTGQGDISVVFTAQGKTYVKLAELGGDSADALSIPRHGRVRMGRDDYKLAGIAEVATRDVPAMFGGWEHKRVRVDSTCEASVTGFAVVAQLSGDPDYAGVNEWSKRTILENGHPVLAARLDNCTGSYARDAALSNVVVPERSHDAAIENAARALLIASNASREIQKTWDAELQGKAPKWYANDAIKTEVVRHPRTGEVFVSAHGQVSASCGDPTANLWGLFRVEQDGSLKVVELHPLDSLDQIDGLLDIENDGSFELIGKKFLDEDIVIARGSGEVLDRLFVPFYGCPC